MTFGFPPSGHFGPCKENVKIKSSDSATQETGEYSDLNILRCEDGQDTAEYAIMIAVILIVLMGVIRLIGSNASNVFSQVGSAIQ